MNTTFKTLLHTLLAFLLSLTFAQCSSDEEKELKEAVESDDADSGEEPSEETDEYEGQDTDEDEPEEDGEEYTEASETASADVLGDMQSVDPMAPSEDEGDTTISSDSYEADPLTSAPSIDESYSANASAPTTTPEMESAPSGWRVWYVKSPTTTAFRDANGSESAGEYSKGESLLLKVEGQWAVMQDGRYIKASALSQKPVSRIRKAGAWR